MKRILSLFALVAIFLASNCSRIPENNDPVLGIWSKSGVTINEDSKSNLRLEWIFNDAYLGRFHMYNGSTTEMQTDFSWKKDGDLYTISYPGTNKLDEIVSMKKHLDLIVLEDNKGNILASKE